MGTLQVAAGARIPQVQQLVHTCPTTGDPCRVVEAVAQHAPADCDRERLAAILARELPCDRCDHAAERAASLPRLRLGYMERTLLANAAEPGGKTVLVSECYPGDSPALQVSARRAALKLEGAGLVSRWRAHRDSNGSTWRRGQAQRGIKLTPLGERVLERIRPAIHEGRRIRWADLGDLADGLALPLADLLQLYRAECQQWAGATGVAANVAALAGTERAFNRASAAAAASRTLLAMADRACGIPEPEKLETRCPRCLREVQGRGGYGDLHLCRDCWGQLGQEWLERDATAEQRAVYAKEAAQWAARSGKRQEG